MSPGRSLPPRGEAPSTVDPEADVDPDADSVHDEPAQSATEHEIREIRRTLRWLARLHAESADREEGRDALLARIADTLDRIGGWSLLRAVVDRVGAIAERLTDPGALTALGVIVRWVGVTSVALAAILYGVQVSGWGVTIGSAIEEALHPADTGTPVTPSGPRPAP